MLGSCQFFKKNAYGGNRTPIRPVERDRATITPRTLQSKKSNMCILYNI